MGLIEKKVFEIDLSGLSSSDHSKFMDFYQLHKKQSPKDIVEAWNKYSNSIHCHIFIKEIENTDNTTELSERIRDAVKKDLEMLDEILEERKNSKH